MSELKIASWSARNPLGIIALFISLIYGMSAVLIGTTAKSLSEQNQTILVCFIVVFPCMVLTVFSWLVRSHHTKLYGPGDYRTDKSFLDAGRTIATKELGRRLEEEISVPDHETKEIEKPLTSPETKIAELVFKGGVGRSWRLSQAYLAEGLVFQALQAELGGSIRRDVVIDGVHIDGLVYESDGGVTVVEVKIISVKSDFSRRIRDARDSLNRALRAVTKESGPRARGLVALVIDGNSGRAAEFKSGIQWRDEEIDLRIFSLGELISRYGFDENAEKA